MSEADISSSSAEETHRLAAALARQCRPGDCILLRGDLGAGKTTFARGFINALCSGHGEVVSPTFTLVQTYPALGGATIWHFDLYRLKNPAEAVEIGLQEALESGICLIEWPELVQSELPGDALDVTIKTEPASERRIFTFSGPEAAWKKRLQDIDG